MALPIPCSGQELVVKITQLQDEINDIRNNCDEQIQAIIRDGSAHIGDFLNTYRVLGDKYLLCNGATIEDTTTYSELIEILGSNVLPTISPKAGRMYIKAKE